MVLTSSDRIPRAPPYSSSHESLKFRLQDYHLVLFIFPNDSTILKFCNSILWLTTSPFNRLYLGNRFCFLFLRLLGCFGSPGIASLLLCIYNRIPILPIGGLPHSDTYGSLFTYNSPYHFAVRRVLLRLLVPRHPPYTLSFLTLQNF